MTVFWIQNGVIWLCVLSFIYHATQVNTNSTDSDTQHYNVSIDTHDGYPVVDVDGDYIRGIHALLQEHDEQFHDPFPGYESDSSNTGIFQYLQYSDNTPVLPDESAKLDRILSRPPVKVRQKRAFIRTEKTRPFPNGRVYFAFDKEYPTLKKPFVLGIMWKLRERIPCVSFLPAPPDMESLGEAGGIVITDKGRGCFATRLGYRGPGLNTILNLAPACGETVTYHEFLHVLGAEHTQRRPDRDQYVSINFDNISPEFVNNYKKVESTIDPEYDYEYDYNSTMHYGSKSFAINSNIPVIEVKRPHDASLLGRGHRAMSPLDITSVRDWYGCGKRCPFGDCGKEAEDLATEPEFAHPLHFTTSLLQRIDMVLQREPGVPDIILQSIEKIEELENDPVTQTSRRTNRMKGRPAAQDCWLGPWYSWSDCKTAVRMRYRVRDILVTKDNKAAECPQAKDLVTLAECPARERKAQARQRGKRNADLAQDPTPRRVISDSKRVQVVEGNDLLLALSNPDLLPIKWFDSSGSELESGHRTGITTTAANNHLLTISNCTVGADHNSTYTSHTYLSNSSLYVVHWNVEVLSVMDLLHQHLVPLLEDWLEVLVLEKKRIRTDPADNATIDF